MATEDNQNKILEAIEKKMNDFYLIARSFIEQLEIDHLNGLNCHISEAIKEELERIPETITDIKYHITDILYVHTYEDK